MKKAPEGKATDDRTTTMHFYGADPDPDCLRVLVVDDVPEVGDLVVRMAARLSYRATMALDAVEALDALQAHPFDLVITAYDMPLINGYELARAIKTRHRGTRVIMMSGSIPEEVSSMPDFTSVLDGILAKPFDLQTMREVIEKVGLSCPQA